MLSVSSSSEALCDVEEIKDGKKPNPCKNKQNDADIEISFDIKAVESEKMCNFACQHGIPFR